MIKRLLKSFGEKLREWFGPKRGKKSVHNYIKTNRNGKRYVDDAEGYIRAAASDDRVYQRKNGTMYIKSDEFAESEEGQKLLKRFTENIETE